MSQEWYAVDLPYSITSSLTRYHRWFPLFKGIDVPNVELIVHYQVAKSLCVLFQRFGRGARDTSLTAKAILLAEPGYFTEVREKRKRDAEVRALRKQKGKMKARAAPESNQGLPRKRLRKDAHPRSTHLSTATPFSPSPLAQEYTPSTTREGSPSSDCHPSPSPAPSPAPSPVPSSPTSSMAEHSPQIESGSLPEVEVGESQDSNLDGVDDSQDAGIGTSTKGKQKRPKKEIELELDSFVNAKTNGLGCYRIAPNQFFRNDKTSKFSL